MSKEKVKVPDLGGADEVEVIEIPVKPGDLVSVDDPLLVLLKDAQIVALGPGNRLVRRSFSSHRDRLGGGSD